MTSINLNGVLDEIPDVMQGALVQGSYLPSTISKVEDFWLKHLPC
jgi:hypothetical protein